ncbi:MAG TPA: hypothetical protein PKV98_04340 [Burkholderiaceae bacterium]|nr:hypothetical protein [Burkholderiaceae bacterium]
MRDFAKVGTSFWTSIAIQGLSDDGKLLALYLITSPHSTSAGVYRLPDGYVTGDLGWTSQRVAKGFQELSEKGFATRCDATFWVFIHKHFQHNAIENPNQAKHVLKILRDVPREATVIPLIVEAVATHEEQFPKGWMEQFIEALSNGSEMVPEQKRERREEREEKEGASPPPCPHQEIVDLYHEILPSHRRVVALNDLRQGLIRGRWRQMWEERGKRGRENDHETLLARFRDFFEDVSKSKFLTGKTNGRDGRPPFVADLEWLMGPQNFLKVLEGKYHEEAA